jgi:hypothetical protein
MAGSRPDGCKKLMADRLEQGASMMNRLISAVVVCSVVVGASTLSGQAIFKTPVVASPFADGAYWYLREPLVWLAYDGRTITVPAGFVTDFASIPRPIWTVLPKWEKYGPAAVVHDYLYWSQDVPRAQADRYFREAMADSHVRSLKRRAIYGAVRLFGTLSWRANQRDKLAMHPRIMERFDWPSSPSETWRERRREIESDREKP